MAAKPDPKQVGPPYMDEDDLQFWRKSQCAEYESWLDECTDEVGRYRSHHDGAVSIWCDFHAELRRSYIRGMKLRKAKRLAAMEHPLVGRSPTLKEVHPDWVDDGRWTR